MKDNQVKKRKRRFSKLLIAITIPLQLAVASLACCLIIFYGPFNTIKKYVVGTAMSTYTHQFIAKMFLSDAQINAILNKDDVNTVGKQQTSGVKVTNIDDSSIDQYEINGKQYHGYMLVISDPTRVKVAYTKKLLTVGETTSQIAKEHNAVAAINGGGFEGGASWTGTGAVPTDFLYAGGKLIWKDSNLSESSDCNVIGLDGQGKLIVGNNSMKDLTKLGISEAVTLPGYHPLVVNGQGTYKNDGGSGMNPRTAIGQKKDGSIMFLVLDGRRVNMLGATLLDVQKIMLDKGAYTAAALDGGSSTTMYYNGNVINNPCSSFGERTVASIFYVQK